MWAIHTSCRLYSKQVKVRVRFAPSPTGEIHLGGLRTALYNFLFARQNKGAFILRIEDTDQARLVPGAQQKLVDILHWAGLRPDEGPGDIGGSHGPYVQSQRLHFYKEASESLVKNGAAYRCFCTEHRLQLAKKDALRRQQVPKYDNKCRNLSDREISLLMAKDTPHVIRFKLKGGIQQYHDLVSKTIRVDLSESEGDFVILKSDAFPTYHLANVVDDHLMSITHVLRGVEWQISTPKHLQLFQALEWTPPQYAHLPLMLNNDGTKLSKRNDGFVCQFLRDNHYFPEAVINFLVLTGGGLGAQTGEYFSMEELENKFQLESLNNNSCRVDLKRLEYFNKKIIAHSEDPSILKETVEIVTQKFPHIQAQYVEQIFRVNKERVTFLDEFLSPKFTFLWEDLPKQKIIPNESRDVYLSLSAELEKLQSFDQSVLSSFLKVFHQENVSSSFKEFMTTLRALLSGLKDGPGVPQMMTLLGKERTLNRISRGL